MATFSVDTETLTELSQRLQQIHAEMAELPGLTTGFQGLLGDRALENDVDEFCSEWTHVIVHLQHETARVITQLNTATTNYVDNEAGVRRSAT